MNEAQKRRSRWERLKLRYQFNIMNEETFEVKSVFSFSILNLVVWVFMFFLAAGLASFALIAYTPLKHYVPGYGKVDDRRTVIEHHMMADSIALWASRVEQKMTIIERVLRGELDTADYSKELFFTGYYDSLELFRRSRADSLLRQEVERRERFSIFEEDAEVAQSLGEIVFFPPVRGVLSDSFNADIGHFGVDVIASQDKDVKAVLDGRVVLSDYSMETGYMIAVMHKPNLLTVYRHNSQLKRKVGNLVRQGEVIAVAGNTGEMTSGPHLHFEMWYNGEPVNPTRYIEFE